MTEWQSISAFSESRNVDRNAVTQYIRRHPEIFGGHTRIRGRNMDIDGFGLKHLDEKYPYPKPVQVINGIDPEEYQAALLRLAAAEAKNSQAMEKISQLIQEQGEMRERLAQGEATRLLLEDKSTQLAKTEDELRAVRERADLQAAQAATEAAELRSQVSERDEELRAVREQAATEAAELRAQVSEREEEMQRLRSRSLWQRIRNK